MTSWQRKKREQERDLFSPKFRQRKIEKIKKVQLNELETQEAIEEIMTYADIRRIEKPPRG